MADLRIPPTLHTLYQACVVGWCIAILFLMPLVVLRKGATFLEQLSQCISEFEVLFPHRPW